MAPRTRRQTARDNATPSKEAFTPREQTVDTQASASERSSSRKAVSRRRAARACRSEEATADHETPILTQALDTSTAGAISPSPSSVSPVWQQVLSVSSASKANHDRMPIISTRKNHHHEHPLVHAEIHARRRRAVGGDPPVPLHGALENDGSEEEEISADEEVSAEGKASTEEEDEDQEKEREEDEDNRREEEESEGEGNPCLQKGYVAAAYRTQQRQRQQRQQHQMKQKEANRCIPSSWTSSSWHWRSFILCLTLLGILSFIGWSFYFFFLFFSQQHKHGGDSNGGVAGLNKIQTDVGSEQNGFFMVRWDALQERIVVVG